MSISRSLLNTALLASLPGLSPALNHGAPSQTAGSSETGGLDGRSRRSLPDIQRRWNASIRPWSAFTSSSRKDRDGRMEKIAATGSGDHFRRRFYILTNHHVPAGLPRVGLPLSNREEVDAVSSGTDA